MKKLILFTLSVGCAYFSQAQKLGTADSSYGNAGSLILDQGNAAYQEIITGSTKGSQGDMYLCGYYAALSFDALITHVNADGSPDANFGNQGTVISDLTLGGNELPMDIIRSNDGKLFVTGYYAGANDYDVFVMKMNADGSFDESFGIGGVALFDFGADDEARKVAVRPDGKIVIAGHTDAGGDQDFFLLLLNADASKVLSFGDQGLLKIGFSTNTDHLTDLVVDATNAMYVGGRTVGANTSLAIAKVKALGILDQVFGQSGRFTFIDGTNNTYLNDLKLDAAGKLVGVGYVSGGINNDIFIFRLNTNGTFDNTFDTDGRRIFGLKIGNPGAERLYGLDLQSDGKIIACGTYLENGINSVMYIRFQDNGKSDPGFGGQYGFVLIPDATFKTALFSHIHVISNERAVIVGRTQKASFDALLYAVHTTEPFPAGLGTIEVSTLRVFPNPARESIHVADLAEPISLTLYSMDGQVVYTWTKGETQLGLPATLSPGMYLLRGNGAETVYQTRVMIH
ncbi:MAG TPA: hypothetical protein DIW47_00950 [Bacteroidetes bacterium]|nr:hypothetical protein [Bacteroidota bacterium]